MTTRLELRAITLSDSKAIQQIFPKWEIVKFLLSGVPWPYPEDGAITFMRDDTLPAVARGEEWAWSIRPRSDPGTLIGVMSLFAKENEVLGLRSGLHPAMGDRIPSPGTEVLTGWGAE
jgi:RimJ/RimL family protein N-acetyltransferase